MQPLKVLCLDIEGGYGGSSRSLYYLLKHLDRSQISPTVWCRRAGPIQARYESIDIPCVLMPDMPKASALPRFSRNVLQSAQLVREFASAKPSLSKLLDASRTHDLIHFNHEGLAGLAKWTRRRACKPQTMHIRTNVRPSIFARMQMRAISRSVDEVAFITSNEEKTFRSLGGDVRGRVIFNVVEPEAEAQPHAGVPRDGRLVIASLSNAAWIRGTDRLLDIAEALKARRRSDVMFVIAGATALSGAWPGALDQLARSGATLEKAVADRDLSRYFHFLGHVPDPERVLAAADLLIKPTREDNPWGRDILEALAAGRPVLSVGQDQTFVETGVTGILQSEFDAVRLAGEICRLADDRNLIVRMGSLARGRVANLCDGKSRANDLAQMWHDVVRNRSCDPSP